MWRVDNALAPQTTDLPKGFHVTRLAISSDGKHTAAVGRNKIAVVDLATGGIQTNRTSFAVEEAAFSPDGKWLALAGQGGVLLWNVASGTQRKLEASSPIAFSGDGRLLAATGHKSSILLPGEEFTLVFEADDWRVFGAATGVPVAFSPHSHLLVARDSETTSLSGVDPTDALNRVCKVIGRSLTQAEWTKYGSDEYQKAC